MKRKFGFKCSKCGKPGMHVDQVVYIASVAYRLRICGECGAKLYTYELSGSDQTAIKKAMNHTLGIRRKKKKKDEATEYEQKKRKQMLEVFDKFGIKV